MAIRNILYAILIGSFTYGGCSSVQHISKTEIGFESVSSKSDIVPDVEITSMIEPYKSTLDVQMNEVIGTVSQELTKKKPESTLGNWYADAMIAGTKKEGHPVDFAISNYGGLRVPYISAGPLTRGEIYELCPFDNLLVIVDVPGDILDSLLQQIASSEGWPVSNGLRMVIKDNKIASCKIHNQSIISSQVYKVAMPDYVANGGDGLKALIPLSRIQTSKLIRDILIEYAQETTRTGKNISASIDGRITIQQ